MEAAQVCINNSSTVSHSVMSDSVAPQTVVHQAPLSIEFSRYEYWSILHSPRILPFPSPEDLPDQGSNPGVLLCRQILYHLSYREINRYMDK